MRIVLFEDHTAARFRPVALSLPLHEIRCGMFNTRERLALAAGVEEGVFLVRKPLQALNRAKGWTAGSGSDFDVSSDRTDLWVSGRLGPRTALLQFLVGNAEPGPDFCLHDEAGPLLARLGSERSTEAFASWTEWAASEDRDWEVPGLTGEGDLIIAPDTSEAARTALSRQLDEHGGAGPLALEWIWDIVPQTAEAISLDLDLVKDNVVYRREPAGIWAQPDSDPVWLKPSLLRPWSEVGPQQAGVVFRGGEFYLAEDVQWTPGLVVDARKGPVILDRGVQVMGQVSLEGPLYIGPGSIVKAGCRIYGESSFGMVNRLAGEIGESTFGDFANKQHDGFIGHAVLGSWVNLGAMTTNSDLKNNYGSIRVDLGDGEIDTGRMFVGLMMGDHAKTAIGSLFNTGTVVGFASNIFGVGMPPKFVPSYSWGGRPGDPVYALDRAVETARTVMERRGCSLQPANEQLFKDLAGK